MSASAPRSTCSTQQADVIDAQINLATSERDVVVASYAILSAIGRLSAHAWRSSDRVPARRSTTTPSRTSGSACARPTAAEPKGVSSHRPLAPSFDCARSPRQARSAFSARKSRHPLFRIMLQPPRLEHSAAPGLRTAPRLPPPWPPRCLPKLLLCPTLAATAVAVPPAFACAKALRDGYRGFDPAVECGTLCH